MKNPWKTLSSRVVYENPWIRVDHREVIAPTGNAGIYGVVNMKSRAMGIIPIDEDGYTWLVGQYRYTTECYSWEIPMGGCPMDEDRLKGAQRELAEEVGLKAQSWEEILTLQTSNCIMTEWAHVYVARDLSPTEKHPDPTESLTLRHLPLEEAIEWARNGQITDSVSVAGLLRLVDYNWRID